MTLIQSWCGFDRIMTWQWYDFWKYGDYFWELLVNILKFIYHEVVKNGNKTNNQQRRMNCENQAVLLFEASCEPKLGRINFLRDVTHFKKCVYVVHKPIKIFIYFHWPMRSVQTCRACHVTSALMQNKPFKKKSYWKNVLCVSIKFRESVKVFFLVLCLNNFGTLKNFFHLKKI